MKTITITVPDDKVEEVQAMLQQYIQPSSFLRMISMSFFFLSL
jgi:hypothetical protein